MFVVTLTYTAPLERLDACLAAHRAWLQDLVARGVVLMAGPHKPREGGFIIAAAADHAELEALLRDDPFAQEGLATYAITEFVAGVTADALAPWRGR
jgi:uncharacterized protein YciI